MNKKYTTRLLMLLSICCCVTIIAGVTRKAAGGTFPAAAAHQTYGGVEHKLGRGGRVVVRNRGGRVRIVGWDRDTVQATATNNEHDEAMPVRISEGTTPATALLITTEGGGGDIYLNVKVPRYAGVESVGTGGGDVEIREVDGTVAVTSSSGDISVSRVGPLEVRTSSGDVVVSEVNGSATLATSSGNLAATAVKGYLFAKAASGDLRADGIDGSINASVSSGDITALNVEEDVRVVSISGDINVRCARGRVEANTTSGTITLTGIGGDVEAATTSADIRFAGVIRADGRYNLKALSGEVQMSVQPDAPSFTATLSSYSGEIETDFPLTLQSPLLRSSPINRRLVGRYSGGGQQGDNNKGATITLNSFSGTVKLNKTASNAENNCQKKKR